MSELIHKNDNRATIRWKLLTGVSALALTVYAASPGVAYADDTDHPLIWLQLGGEMDNIGGQGAVFAPSFLAANPNSPVLNSVTPLQAQQPAKFGFGEEGKISFQPEDSNWIFSAAIRYGRSSSSREVDHQTKQGLFHTFYKYGHGSGNPKSFADFADTQAHRQESHTILDFSAGKDVGLGLFGRNVSSVLSLGVRFAQFTSASRLDIRARPDLKFEDESFPTYHVSIHLPYFHTYHATGDASRSFHGVGPSLSWNGSAPFAGNSQDGELAVDWGFNAALLFGRQKAHVRHHETGHYVSAIAEFGNPNNAYALTYDPLPGGHDAIRSVTVPNVGGSIGLSWRVQNFKASLGYRTDFFFGAMDTGIDAVKKSNAAFSGPYASISIGVGD